MKERERLNSWPRCTQRQPLRSSFAGTLKIEHMHNRFSRPFGPEQVETLVLKLREVALAREASDPLAADIIFKSLHMVTTLWRECALHDNLTKAAEQVLDATETRLRQCLAEQSVDHAAEVLAEVERLRRLIKEPPERHEPWPDEPRGPSG